MANGRGWGGKFRGQAQRWFYFRINDESEINLEAHEGHAPEFCEWKWVPFNAAMLEDIVPFKRRVYAELLKHFDEVVAKSKL